MNSIGARDRPLLVHEHAVHVHQPRVDLASRHRFAQHSQMAGRSRAPQAMFTRVGEGGMEGRNPFKEAIRWQTARQSQAASVGWSPVTGASAMSMALRRSRSPCTCAGPGPNTTTSPRSPNSPPNTGSSSSWRTNPRRAIRLRGTADAIGGAFEAQLKGIYEHPSGVRYRGREGTLTIPVELDGVVTSVLGIDDRPQARPKIRFAPPRGALLHAGRGRPGLQLPGAGHRRRRDGRDHRARRRV